MTCTLYISARRITVPIEPARSSGCAELRRLEWRSGPETHSPSARRTRSRRRTCRQRRFRQVQSDAADPRLRQRQSLRPHDADIQKYLEVEHILAHTLKAEVARLDNPCMDWSDGNLMSVSTLQRHNLFWGHIATKRIKLRQSFINQ